VVAVASLEWYHSHDWRQWGTLSFKDWKAGDFAVWGSRLRASHAAIDVLLPLAAVAFGLTAIGIVFLFAQ
jgi:hypothetical protein